MKILTVPNYLLDTNVVIEAFLGIEPSATFVKQQITEGTIALSAIVIAEYLSKASKEEKEKLSLLTAKFGVLPVNQTIAEIAGAYRQEFNKKTKKVYLLDCLIAATAKLYNLTLVTNNGTDYPMKDISVKTPKTLL